MRAAGRELCDRDTAGDAGLAMITVRAVTVGSAATKTMLDQLVVDGHVEPYFRVGYKVTAQSVVKIAAGRFSRNVEL